MNWASSAWTGAIPLDQMVPTPAVTITYDAATEAWVAVVGSGNVSPTLKNAIDALIVGLKADGIWTKLDRLWWFAAGNTTCALVDIKGLATATEVAAPTFTANIGYTSAPTGPTKYIDSGFNVATGTNYLQNSASLFIWCNTTGVNTSQEIAGNGNDRTVIIPRQTGTAYFPINDNGAVYGNSGTVADSRGFYHANRSAASGAGCAQGYKNGSSVATGSTTSAAPTGNMFFGRGLNGATFQFSCAGVGGSLNATEAGNLYTRIRTALTAVGIP